MTHKNKPLFITFEGGEGAGKSTLIERLFKTLKEDGYRVLKVREPGGTALGEEIRTLLLHQNQYQIGSLAELLLFLASRAQHIEEVIQPHLDQGYIILCDRFNDSTIAYQGIAREIGKDRTEKLCQLATEPLMPNLTFILDLNPNQGLKRAKAADDQWDRLEDLKVSFHEKVQRGYQLLAKENPKRIRLIDAMQSPDEVFDEAWDHLSKLFNT